MMQNPSLLLKVTRHLYQKKTRIKQAHPKGDAGFTLLELLVVIILMGVIAAIAAPSWSLFMNQRRVNAANNVVLQSLQEAQSLARTRKVSYSVSFRVNDGVPEIAIYPTERPDPSNPNRTVDVDPTDADFNNRWKSLGQDLAIKSGQVLLGTNLNGENSGVPGSPSYPASTTGPIPKITFDYMGTLPNTSFPDNPKNDALIIEVAVPVGNSPNQIIESTRRCVKVQTLLGSIQSGRIDECNP
jgi:prepilin-type N-terminal cleavage/methylation domain-containing protein